MTSEMPPAETPAETPVETPAATQAETPVETSVETRPADVLPAEAPAAGEMAPPEALPADVLPVEAPPAQETAPAEMAPASDLPAKAPAPLRKRRDRVLGTAGQVVGVVGIVVCLLLVVGMVVGRSWAVGTVDDVTAAVDAQIAKADPLLTQASAKVGEISGRVGAVADIAAGIAANPSPGGSVADTLRAGLASVSDRYQTLRANYADVRETVVSMVDRLQTLGRIVPGVSIPQGPIDALSALDARLQAFDAKVTGLITIDPGNGPVNQAAAAIASAVSDVNTKLTDLQGGIGDVQDRVSTLRTRLSDAASTIKLAITLGAFGSVLLFLYLAFLHWVLFRHSGEIRRKASAVQ